MSEQRSTLVRDLLIATALLGGLGAYLVWSPSTPPLEAPPSPSPSPTGVLAEGTQVTSDLVLVKKTVVEPSPDKPYDPSSAILIDLLQDGTKRPTKALSAILSAKDVRFIPVLADLLGMTQRKKSTALNPATIMAALQRLARQPLMKWSEWYRVVASAPQLEPPPDYSRFKPGLYARADKRYARLLAHGVATRIRLVEVSWNGRRIGQVPPLVDPPHVELTASWLKPQDLVLGVRVGALSRAYPLRILDAHESINDQLGATPIAVLLDPLSGAPRVYRAQVAGKRHRFFNSGLIYRGNKLLISGRGNLWQQLTGEAVIGPLAKAAHRLTAIPSVVTTWAVWRAQHPSTTLLSETQKPLRDYSPGLAFGSYYAHDKVYYPSFPQKPLLPNKRWVVGVTHADAAAAFELEALLDAKVKNGVVGEANVLLVAQRGPLTVSGTTTKKRPVRYSFGAEVRAYRRKTHSFKPGPKPGVVLDQAGKTWTVSDDALLGPAGAKLERIPADLGYWFTWLGFHPETTLHPAPK